jgi:hypothetical protein
VVGGWRGGGGWNGRKEGERGIRRRGRRGGEGAKGVGKLFLDEVAEAGGLGRGHGGEAGLKVGQQQLQELLPPSQQRTRARAQARLQHAATSPPRELSPRKRAQGARTPRGVRARWPAARLARPSWQAHEELPAPPQGRALCLPPPFQYSAHAVRGRMWTSVRAHEFMCTSALAPALVCLCVRGLRGWVLDGGGGGPGRPAARPSTRS